MLPFWQLLLDQEGEVYMRCVDCNSDSVQSKGYRGISRRYLCNDCGRNFTVNPERDAQEKQVIKDTQDKANDMTTIQISKDLKGCLDNKKLCKGESYNEVLIRLLSLS